MLEIRFVEVVRTFAGPELMLAQNAVFVQIECRPTRLARRPVVERFPLAGGRDEAADWWLVHDAVVDAFEPVIEPAQRFVLILINWPVEINRRADDHFFRPLP